MNYKKMYKKSPQSALSQIVADWGREIYDAKGRQKLVDAVMAKYLKIETEIARLCEYSKGYKIAENWLQCAIAQSVQSQATVQMFDQYRLDYTSAMFPNAEGVETIEKIDISEALNCDKGTLVIRVKMIPVEGYPAGCVVVSSKRKKYDVITRNANGTYTVIAHETIKGKHREYVLTPFQMVKMQRVK